MQRVFGESVELQTPSVVSDSDWLEQPVLKRSGPFSRIWQVQGESLPCFDSQSQLNRAMEQGRKLKNDKTTTVVDYSFEGQNYIIKRYNPRSAWHHLSRSVRRSRASRCWRMSYAFSRAGVSVAQPIAVFEQRFLFFRRNAYFISRKLQGDELLEVLPGLSELSQEKVAQAMQAILSKFAKARLSHGDMKASNIIVHRDALYFIDLDAAQQHQSAASWKRAIAKDKKRFLKNWRGNDRLLRLFRGLRP